MTSIDTAGSTTDDSATTGSRGTKMLGAVLAVAIAALAALALFITPPEVTQADSVRLFYIHVPSAIVSLYIAFSITLVGSIMYLWKQSVFWDLLAEAAAEIGVIFLGITLITGMLWGRPTWGTYWIWDPRLTSTAVSFVLYSGYLAVRRLDMDPTVRSKRAAVLGIVSFANLIIVRYSVEWWDSLHQGVTIDPIDTQMDGIMLFTFFFGVVTMVMLFAWLLIHRFRVAWLEHQIAEVGLTEAIEARRREGVS